MNALHHHLVVHVHCHDGRFHGAPEWPPAPARLFQALVASAGPDLDDPQVERALTWLEALGPPQVGTPPATRGQAVTWYVPHNDLDAKGGDPAKVADLRVAKDVHPWLLHPDTPFLYVWRVPPEAAAPHLDTLARIVDGLYQFGRGIDPAWARLEVVDAPGWADLLGRWPGTLHEPAEIGLGGTSLACPTAGSLASLRVRFQRMGERLTPYGKGRSQKILFSQPPKPRFRQVAYDARQRGALIGLRSADDPSRFVTWPLDRAHDLVIALRDAAVQRLEEALPHATEDIRRALIGRTEQQAHVPTEARVQFVPVPSIGHPEADRQIRRVLVQIGPSVTLRPEDLLWALSGLTLPHSTTGVSLITTLGEDDSILRHFGHAKVASDLWQTITPIAVPERAARRRIDPEHPEADAKDGPERAAEHARAEQAIRQALRHAGLHGSVAEIRVQREPFSKRGARAEAFAASPRFPKERLWHAEVRFHQPCRGPLVVGSGRFAGLGLLEPIPADHGVFALHMDPGDHAITNPEQVARALRSATMSRVGQGSPRGRSLPSYVSGHRADGSPLKDGAPHLRFACDPERQRLLIFAAHAGGRHETSRYEAGIWREVQSAMRGMTELLAGRQGRMNVRAAPIEPGSDPLLRPSTTWRSLTPYVVMRHRKGISATAALEQDVRKACEAAGLPRPKAVTVHKAQGRSGVGLTGELTLEFEVAVSGPLTLGRTRYLGGGLFEACDRQG